MIKQSMEAAEIYAKTRETALANGDEKQIEILKEKLGYYNDDIK